MARDFLAKGTEWVVGDGRQINIFKDKWISLMPNFSMMSRSNVCEVNLQYVHDIIGFEKNN